MDTGIDAKLTMTILNLLRKFRITEYQLCPSAKNNSNNLNCL